MAHRRIAGGGEGDEPEGLTRADLDGFAAPLLPLVGDIDLARLAVEDAWRSLRIEGADYSVNDPAVRAWLEGAITDHVKDALARTGGDRASLWAVFGAGVDDPADAAAPGFSLASDDEAALSFVEPPHEPPAAPPPPPPPMAPAPRGVPMAPYKAPTARVIPLWPVSVSTGRTTPPTPPVDETPLPLRPPLEPGPPAAEAVPRPTPSVYEAPSPAPPPTPPADEAPPRPVPAPTPPAAEAPLRPAPAPTPSVYDVPPSPLPAPPVDEPRLRPVPEPTPPADEVPVPPSAVATPDDLPVWRESTWGRSQGYVPRRRHRRRRWRPILGWGLLSVLLLLTLALLWLALTPLTAPTATDPSPAPPPAAPVNPAPPDGFERFEAPDAVPERVPRASALPESGAVATGDVPSRPEAFEPDIVPEPVPQATALPEPDDGAAAPPPDAAAAAAVPGPVPPWLVLPKPADVPTRVGPMAPVPSAAITPPDPEGTPAALDPPTSPPANAAAPRPRVFVHYAEGGGSRAVARAERLADRVGDAGFAEVNLRSVPFAVETGSVRYFYAADRVFAERLIETLGGTETTWRLTDFTTYRPLPRPGTLEVWLPRG